MTLICGINGKNPAQDQVAIWSQDTCHLHCNKYGKGRLVRSWKALPDWKIQIGTYFKSEKCYPEIWTAVLQSKTRLKDLKTQKLH